MEREGIRLTRAPSAECCASQIYPSETGRQPGVADKGQRVTRVGVEPSGEAWRAICDVGGAIKAVAAGEPVCRTTLPLARARRTKGLQIKEWAHSPGE